MKECCSTVTIPLEEYNELKNACLYVRSTSNWRSYQVYLKIPNERELTEDIRKDFDEMIFDLRKENKSFESLYKAYSQNLRKIPKFIRKIFGA